LRSSADTNVGTSNASNNTHAIIVFICMRSAITIYPYMVRHPGATTLCLCRRLAIAFCSIKFNTNYVQFFAINTHSYLLQMYHHFSRESTAIRSWCFLQKSNTSSVTMAPGKISNSTLNFAKFKVGSNVIYTTKAGNNKIYVVQPTTEKNQIVIRPTGVTNDKSDKIIKTKNEFEKLRKRPTSENVDWRNEILKKFPTGTKVTYRSKNDKTNRIGTIGEKTNLANGTISKIDIYNKSINTEWVSGLHNPVDLVIESSGVYLYVTNSGNGTISQIQISSGVIINSDWITGLNSPSGLVIDTGNTYMYVANSTDNTVSQIQISSGVIINSDWLTVSNGLLGLVVDRNNTYLYISNFRNNTIEKKI
jgi:DNA-binding beta-propeller fold protein YncE